MCSTRCGKPHRKMRKRTHDFQLKGLFFQGRGNSSCMGLRAKKGRLHDGSPIRSKKSQFLSDPLAALRCTTIGMASRVSAPSLSRPSSSRESFLIRLGQHRVISTLHFDRGISLSDLNGLAAPRQFLQRDACDVVKFDIACGQGRRNQLGPCMSWTHRRPRFFFPSER